MFRFARCPPRKLCIHSRVTRHNSSRISPFGYPGINASVLLPREFRCFRALLRHSVPRHSSCTLSSSNQLLMNSLFPTDSNNSQSPDLTGNHDAAQTRKIGALLLKPLCDCQRTFSPSKTARYFLRIGQRRSFMIPAAHSQVNVFLMEIVKKGLAVGGERFAAGSLMGRMGHIRLRSAITARQQPTSSVHFTVVQHELNLVDLAQVVDHVPAVEFQNVGHGHGDASAEGHRDLVLQSVVGKVRHRLEQLRG